MKKENRDNGRKERFMTQARIVGETVVVAFSEHARAFMTIEEYRRLVEKKRLLPLLPETERKN